MSVHSVDLGGAGSDPEDTHELKIKDKFHCNHEWFANVHAPISIPQAMKIPKAKAALDKEWNKLESKQTWLTETVRAKKDVMAECKRIGKRAHFGSLMDLCEKKNSQLSEEHWIYKGRVVFRGGCVKDEQGFHAVFSEQGTSASHMSAAKLIDALSRCDGMDGQDADAVGAYTQVTLKDMADEMGEEFVDTWITLPKHKQSA